MRSIWNASIVIGTIAIPVGLAPAHKRAKPAFRTLHRPCGTPVKEQAYCPACGEADPQETVRGWEIAPGQYVPVDDELLAQLQPQASRMIRVERVIALDEVGPLLLNRAYHLVPSPMEVGRRAYLLLAQALEHAGAAAVCRFTMRSTEQVAVVRAHQRGLLVQTLHLPDELQPADEITDLLDGVTVAANELQLAETLLARLTGPLAPALVSEQRDRLRQLLDDRAVAGEILAVQDMEVPALTADLAGALERSLRAVRPPSRRRRRRRARA